MAAQTIITILGCGSSGGVPRIGGNWGACDPANPKNARRRCSILVRRTVPDGDTTVLVDTSPDLRAQLLDAGVRTLDGVLFTHAHADHTHGIDDLRAVAINNRSRVPVHFDRITGELMEMRFAYCFKTPPKSTYPPILEPHPITPGMAVRVSGEGGDITAMPFDVTHGDIDALGFRFGDIAYTPDLSDVPENAVQYLEGLDVWIIDALRRTPHPSHFSLDDALKWISRFKPKRAVLTNMHIDLDYDTLIAELPDTVEPAFDGQVIEFD